MIEKRNQAALAYLELAGDQVFQKLPEKSKIKLIREVLAIGKKAADQILKEHKTGDPRRIATNRGLKVLGGERQKGKKRGVERGAEYQKGKKEITVYRRFNERLIKEVKSSELSDNLIKFMVAHELFHFLEADQLGAVYKRFKFPVWRFGPFACENYIKGLSNVAAQAFTRTLLGLEFSPQVFDYLAYILYTAQALLCYNSI